MDDIPVVHRICWHLHNYAISSILVAVKSVFWMGSSKEDLRDFPAVARREVGYQLEKVQRDDEPSDWKPMSTIGPGVREIRVRDRDGALRVFYLSTRPDGIYVLHCFQKKMNRRAG
jgi:phage-related protein